MTLDETQKFREILNACPCDWWFRFFGVSSVKEAGGGHS
jgi:hypothetical protein